MIGHNLIEIGKRLRKTRKILKLTQEQMAQKLDTTDTSLSEYENGKTRPSFEVLFRLSHDFNVNLEFLFHGRGDIFYSNLLSSDRRSNYDFSDLNKEIHEILEIMQVSKFARSGIYTLAKEFLHRNRIIVEKDMENTREYEENIDNGNHDQMGGGK